MFLVSGFDYCIFILLLSLFFKFVTQLEKVLFISVFQVKCVEALFCFFLNYELNRS